MPKKKNDAVVEPTNGFSAEKLIEKHRAAHAELGGPALVADLAKGDPAAYGKVLLALEDHIRWFTTTPEGKLARKKGEGVPACYITAAFGKHGEHLKEWLGSDENRSKRLEEFLVHRKNVLAAQSNQIGGQLRQARGLPNYRATIEAALRAFVLDREADNRTRPQLMANAISLVEVHGRELRDLGDSTHSYRRGIVHLAKFMAQQLKESVRDQVDGNMFREHFGVSRDSWQQGLAVLDSIIERDLRQVRRGNPR